LHHFATFIKAAFGANAVWHARLTAIRAQGGLGDAQSVVRASFAGASFRVSSFRIWHNYLIKFTPQRSTKSTRFVRNCFALFVPFVA